jgi:O-succinylbenzoate synthase
MALIHRGFRIPLRHPFRGMTHREGLLFLGTSGWSEYSPLPGFTEEARRRCLSAAFSLAFTPWPRPVRDRVAVQVTVPALAPEQAHALVMSSGCRSAKVKVAEGDDEARLEAVRDALGPRGRIVVDANGAWDVDGAVRALARFSRYGVDLAEQPVAGIAELAELRRLVDMPIAADECVASPRDAQEVAARQAADVLVVKVQLLGGVIETLRVIEAAGLPVIVSSLLETSVGLAAGLVLAASLPTLEYPCGLGTIPLFEGDVVADSLVPVDGEIVVRRPQVDPAALSRFEAEVALPSFASALT